MPVLLLPQSASVGAVTGTATFDQAAGSWDATAVEKFTATATWSQAAAVWDATASEKISGTASWTQDASWAATATERFTSTASFVQAAATWDAAALERLVATTSWTQDATWEASATQSIPNVTATASWEQTASWDAVMQGPAVEEPDQVPRHGSRAARVIGPARQRRVIRPPKVTARASFSQEPASWHAAMTVNDDALVLVLL